MKSWKIFSSSALPKCAEARNNAGLRIQKRLKPLKVSAFFIVPQQVFLPPSEFPAVLFFIHQPVSKRHILVERIVFLRHSRIDSETGADITQPGIAGIQAIDRFSGKILQFFCFFRTVEDAVGQEFVTADMYRHKGIRFQFFHGLPHPADGGITGLMAEFIVDVFEVIAIEHRDCKVLLHPFLYFSLQFFLSHPYYLSPHFFYIIYL